LLREPLKIAVTGTRGFPNVQGGVETHCERLYPCLAALGQEVTVFARSPYVSYKTTIYEGVNLVAIDCPQSKHLEAIVHTGKAVLRAKELRPDILHIQAIGPSLFTPLARILGMKVVVTHHGENYKHEKWGFLARQFLRLSEFVGALSANEIIAISDYIASLIEAKYNRNATVIPNGVEISRPVETMKALTRFGLEKGKYILAVGRFVPEKGFHDLIEAFGRAALHGWKLAIAGRADHEDAYSTSLREQADGNANVVLTGFLKGTPLQELYSHAGLFVLPSYYEGLPIVLLEALSYGLRCIVSDIPANRISGLRSETRSEERETRFNIELQKASGKQLAANGGRFFKTGDVDDLAGKIAEFAGRPMNDEEKRAQIAMIEREYNWDKIADETLKVYRRAIT
jgi:glycosyltransferase involved in cell wall biosynthesis